MPQAALYARVSTRNQEKEATIESQLALVDVYAQAQGYTIAEPHRFIDEAVSGSRLARPGLDRLRDAAKAKAFTVVLCLEPARLARNLGVQQVVLEELKRWGIAVIFVDQPEMAKDAHSQFWLQLRGAVAEYERTLISDRMRRGRLHRLRQGQTVPTQAPYGYAYVAASRERPSHWIIREKEAEIVRQLFVWYATGDKSLGDLARLLNVQAVLSPEQRAWQAPALVGLLRQPAYKGSAYYNRQQSDPTAIGLPRQTGRGHLSHPRYQERPADEWIQCPVPPLVEEGLWTQVQEQLTMQQRFSQRNSQRAYLLRSLLVCHVCGHTLQGRSQPNGHPHYVCPYGGKHCPPGVRPHRTSLRADVVEPLVWDALRQLLDHPQRIADAWQALHADQPTDPSDHRFWQNRLASLTKERVRLLDAFQAGLLSLDELTLRSNPLAEERRSLEARLAKVAQPAPLQLSLPVFTQRIQRALDASDFATQQDVIRLLIERILVSDDALAIEHIVPLLDTSRLDLTCRDT
jgi:site-specific DNA recombinase